MSEANINPYEPPRVDCDNDPPEEGKVWRHGDLLVMCGNSIVPNQCWMTGAPAVGYQEITMSCNSSHFPVIIRVPFSQEAAEEFQHNGIVTLALTIAGIALMGLGSYLAMPQINAWIALVPIGFILMLAAVIWRFKLLRRVWMEAEQGDYFLIGGVHPACLAELPEWPYEPK